MPTSILTRPTHVIDKISSNLGHTDDFACNAPLRSQISALGLHDLLLEEKVYKVLSVAQYLGLVVSLNGDCTLSLLNVLQNVLVHLSICGTS